VRGPVMVLHTTAFCRCGDCDCDEHAVRGSVMYIRASRDRPGAWVHFLRRLSGNVTPGCSHGGCSHGILEGGHGPGHSS
jgi:hypothetical protein